ncbi:insulinase family protein [Rhodospirillaceae bacterium KN72]|uniref:Insulinase family protein n=1 Tax=Pacificispira spongiicola TaxID=2729598 RepID=A0A7Y0HDJ2_9PROT|nr:pitrilysin family protein [Pacificispira spongiicola]NMM43715.1 insulinase family protein [Pacificispira spongiicola]
MTTARVSTLDSGLRVATDSMPGVGTASIGVWVGAGTRAEPKEINGVAHFLEHMAFKGTATRTARRIAEEIEAVGGHLNAYTARENTAYYAKVLADDLPLAVDIVADILQNPSFDPQELERERGVILQEIGQCFDTPDDIVYDRFQEVAYPDQAMGRPVLGTVDTVKAMPRESIQGFMTNRYAGENMVLCAAGKVDHDSFVDLAREKFKTVGPARDTDITPSRYTGGEYREDRDSEQVHLLLGFEGPSFEGRDYYTAGVLSALLGGGMSSRLFQSIREERGLVYSIYSFAWTFADSGLFGIYAGTGEDDVVELVPVVADEITTLADTLTDEEIERAITQMRASLIMARESSGARSDQLGNQILIHGRPMSVEEQVAAVEAVDKTALQALARRMFTTAPTVAAIGPVSKLETYERIADRLRA